MKTQLIMLDTPIIVSDEEILRYNAVLHKGKIETATYINHNGDVCLGGMYGLVIPANDVVKIIAGIEGLASIDWNGLEEQFGLVDVEKLAEKYFNDYYAWIRDAKEPYTEAQISQIKVDYINGFKKAQSLNEKKFSLEEVVELSKQLFANKFEHTGKTLDCVVSDYIKYLQQPKVFEIEIETETTFYTKDIPYSRPKITNNSIKILRKL